VPKPFTEIIVIYGQPMLIPQRVTEEEVNVYQKKLADELMELEARLDTILAQGHSHATAADV
jgi:lysophospholipid acyltransferase (LPLAT)-like uncharacterized protein